MSCRTAGVLRTFERVSKLLDGFGKWTEEEESGRTGEKTGRGDQEGVIRRRCLGSGSFSTFCVTNNPLLVILFAFRVL